MTKLLQWTKLWMLGILSVALPLAVQAQDEDDEDVFELSQFSVEAGEDDGYMATTTLAGSRVRSNVRDLGASIAIVTEEFMQDTGATDGESLLQFVGNVEVGGVLGNFSNVNADNGNTNESRINPQRAQRVRGLVSATLTRDYFQTDIPFDAYNTSRVTVNRGPNSILFGLGSPGGVINNTTNRAQIGSDFGEISVRFDTNNGHRQTFEYNKTLVEDRLAIRVNMMNENVKFRQEPAFEDDTRFFVAWDAVLFKNEGSDIVGRTTFRGSFENGEIYRNPPDVVGPIDGFSSWWNGIGSQDDLNRLLSVPGVDLTDISNQAVTQQQVIAAVNAGLATPSEGLTLEEYAAVEGQFVPRQTVDRFKRGNPLGNDPTEGGRNLSVQTTPYFLFPAVNFNSVNATIPGWNSPELAGIQGIMGRFRPNGFATQDVRWTNAATAGAGFGASTLTDRNVFDYHKNLFQGSTNYIETDFEIQQFVLEQELFNGSVGVEIAWDKQSQDRERFTPFSSGANKTIAIDLGQNHAPGDSNFDGIPDRLENENVGRPVVDWDANNTTYETSEQETFRATLFGTLNFRDFMDGKLGKILGSHTLTGLFEDRTNDNWNKNVRGSWWADSSKWPGDADISNGLSDNFRRIVKSQIYLGPDTRGFASADDVRIDGPINVPFPKIGDTYGIWYFDNDGQIDSDQRANWRIIENIANANISRSELKSEAFSLQSRLFDNHIIGMYAIRNDKQTVYQRIQENTTYGDPNDPGVIPLRLDLPGINEVDGTFNEGLLELEPEPASIDEDDTTTWSIVAKFPEMFFELPFGIDLTGHYYEAESFQPAGISNNVLNQPLASPFGSTEEYGFTISLFENRLSIRANWFETSNANARTGNMNGQLPQIGNRFQFFLDRITSAENSDVGLFPNAEDALLTPDTNPSNRQRLSGTDADIAGFNTFDEYYAAIIGAIPSELQAVRNFRVETLESGEVVDDNDPIRGLNSTQDFVAEGMEIDIVGRITDSLSISLNVAQQETVTTNTGPVAIPLALKIREILDQPIPGSPGGWSLAQLRDSPFQVETGTIGTRYDVVIREMLIQSGKDNTVSQEQREWRVNATARYDFLDGPLKGFQIGGSLRYQDEISGGYPNKLAADGETVLPDIANPWFGPDEMTGDMFLRYNRKLTDKIDWTIQLNARNLYRDRGAKDIPITFNPDGSVALARIPVEQQFFLTNTFSF